MRRARATIGDAGHRPRPILVLLRVATAAGAVACLFAGADPWLTTALVLAAFALVAATTIPRP
jgi:hypothetical protein